MRPEGLGIVRVFSGKGWASITLLVLGVAIGIVGTVVYQQVRAPKSWSECVLRSMKNVGSDVAARHIEVACDDYEEEQKLRITFEEDDEP